MNRLRVLHLFVSLPVVAAENLLLSILRRLDPTRYGSVVCTLGEKGVFPSRFVTERTASGRPGSLHW